MEDVAGARHPLEQAGERRSLEALEDRDLTQRPARRIKHSDEVLEHAFLQVDPGEDLAFAIECIDRAVFRHEKVVVDAATIGPEDPGPGVQLDEPEPLIDPQQIAVWIEIGAPPVFELRHAGIPGEVRPEPAQRVAPAMQGPALHVHEHGLGRVTRNVEVEPLESGPVIVLDHRGEILGRPIALQIRDGFDVGCCFRGSRATWRPAAGRPPLSLGSGIHGDGYHRHRLRGRRRRLGRSTG
jgi:hypothetical protein